MKYAFSTLLPIIAVLCFVPTVARANSGDFSGGVAIGTSYAAAISAPTNGLAVQGRMSIGTSVPTAPLEISANAGALDSTGGLLHLGNADGSSTAIVMDSFGAGGAAIISGRAYGGTSASHTALAAGVNIISVSGQGYNGTSVGGGVGLNMQTGGAWSTTSEPTQIQFNTTPVNATSPQVRLFISSSGAIGIGNVSPAQLLHVGTSSVSGIVMQLQNSSGACTYNPGASSVTVSCSSDAKLKSDIVDAPSALSWLGDMRIRDFTVKATGERKTGVIAQEMLTKHPDMVHKNAEGTYLVDEPNPWKLVKAVQEQEAEIQRQRALSQKQQAEINELKKAIAQLTNK